MWIPVLIVTVLVIILVYEYRLRKPDQLVLYESGGNIFLRKSRFYPRHLSLVLPKTIHSVQMEIDASAKGNLDVKVKVAMSVALSLDHIHQLITAGGWNSAAVQKATKELEMTVYNLVREFTEKHEVEELTSERISEYLRVNIGISKEMFGLTVISISVQSLELMDTRIADAIRQQESARILEQTEALHQKARIAAAKARLEAEEHIAAMESDLELKKLDLKRAEIEREASIAERRVQEELKRKKMQLAYEKEELELLRNNPELLILTPQVARLAEASQSLKNARTVVTLSPNELAHATDVSTIVHKFLERLTNQSKKSRVKSNE